MSVVHSGEELQLPGPWADPLKKRVHLTKVKQKSVKSQTKSVVRFFRGFCVKCMSFVFLDPECKYKIKKNKKIKQDLAIYFGAFGKFAKILQHILNKQRNSSPI